MNNIEFIPCILIFIFGFLSLFNLTAIKQKYRNKFVNTFLFIVTIILISSSFEFIFCYKQQTILEKEFLPFIFYIVPKIAHSFIFFFIYKIIIGFNKIFANIFLDVFFFLILSILSVLQVLSFYKFPVIANIIIYIENGTYIFLSAIYISLIIKNNDKDSEDKSNEKIVKNNPLLFNIILLITLETIKIITYCIAKKNFTNLINSILYFLIIFSGAFFLYKIIVKNYLYKISLEKINESLSDQEIDIIKFICLGLSSKEIGFRLNLSEGTIRNKLTVIYKKTGVSKRIELLEYYRKN